MVKLLSTSTGEPLQVVPVASAGDPVFGIVQRVYTVMTQTWVSVIVRGKTKITATGSIAAGAKLKAWTQTKVAAWVSGTDAVGAAFGTALQAASSGDTIFAIVDCACV